MSEEHFEPNPARFRKAREPHPTPEAAEEAAKAFHEAVCELRVKYQIKDVYVIYNVALIEEDGKESVPQPKRGEPHLSESRLIRFVLSIARDCMGGTKELLDGLSFFVAFIIGPVMLFSLGFLYWHPWFAAMYLGLMTYMLTILAVMLICVAALFVLYLRRHWQMTKQPRDTTNGP